ncbi:unnamed protein product [Acanthoscelides obtectus]|uniref:CCHC-type domain-containing protein n=1 Tax=Acanthoscelides obtectus TaxID=200917 RepID=A0A9P0LJG4_ACAOB|nr:unnamed protein product [Acanthoscelides obtectus]CAK1675056.1 hypothetical protein AOBTE_LOCUS29871 [Acanthoscelides obtectus]
MTSNPTTSQNPTPKSYSKVVSQHSEKHPNKEQAIVFSTIEGAKLQDYLLKLGPLVEPKNIIFCSRISNNRICVYLSSKSLVDQFIQQHGELTVNGEIIKVRRLVTPSDRLVISNVCPTIPHAVLNDALQKLHLKLLSPISFLRIGATLAEYSHILSFRRQVYIAPSENTDIPESIEITHNDLTYRIFLTLDSQKCYKCKLIGHIASQCPSIKISQTSTESETLNDELSNPSENQVVSDITTEDSTTAHIHLPKENTKAITNKNSHQHPQNTNTNIISLHGEGTPNNDELITPSVSSKRSFSEILTPTEDTGAPQSYQQHPTAIANYRMDKHENINKCMLWICVECGIINTICSVTTFLLFSG